MGICHWIIVTGFTFLLSTAEISQKHIYDNGIKEFTVTKEIKRNDCACACTCVPDGLPFGSPAPPPPAPDKTAPQKFVITKQFKGNMCSCSCTCSPKQASATSVATLLTTIAAVTSVTPPSTMKSMVTAVEDSLSVASTRIASTSSVPFKTTLAADSRHGLDENLKKEHNANFEESNDDQLVTARHGQDKQASLVSGEPVTTRPASTPTANNATVLPSPTEQLASATTTNVATTDGSTSMEPERSSLAADTPRGTSASQLPSSIASLVTTADDNQAHTSTEGMPAARPSESSASTSRRTLPAVGSSTLSTADGASDNTVKKSEGTTQQGIETSSEEDDRMTAPVNELTTTAVAADLMQLARTAAGDTSRRSDVQATTTSPSINVEASIAPTALSQKPIKEVNSTTKAAQTPDSGTTTARPSESHASNSSPTLPAEGSGTASTSEKASDQTVKESEATTQQGIETSSEEDDRMTDLVRDLPTTAVAADVIRLSTTAADDISRKSDVPAATISTVSTDEADIASSLSSQKSINEGNSPTKATRTQDSGTTAEGSTPTQQTHSSDFDSAFTAAPSSTESPQAPTAQGSTATVVSTLLSTAKTSTASDLEESNLDDIATEIEQTADLVTTSSPGDTTPSDRKETTSGEHAKAVEEFKGKAMDLLTRLRETVARARVNLHPDSTTTSRQGLTTLAEERTTKAEPTIGETTTDLRTTAPPTDELAEPTSVPRSPDERESEFRIKAASLLERLQKKLDDLRSKAKASAVSTSTVQSVSPVESVTEVDASSPSTRVFPSSSEPSSSRTTHAEHSHSSSVTSETTKMFVATAGSTASTATTQQSTEAGSTLFTQGPTTRFQQESDIVTGTNEASPTDSTSATSATSPQSPLEELDTESSKGDASVDAQSTTSGPRTLSSGSKPTVADDDWGSATGTITTETELITHESLTLTSSETVHPPVSTTVIPSAATRGSSLESTASLPSSRTDLDAETEGTTIVAEQRQQRTSQMFAASTTPEPVSSDVNTVESSTSVSPTDSVQRTTAKRTMQSSFAFVTAPPENGSLSTNAEVVQSITTHLLMTLSRALSTQTTTETNREASTNGESNLEHILESVLNKDNQSSVITPAPTGNSFVQGIGNGGTTVHTRANERIRQQQPTTPENGNDIQTAPDSVPAENHFDSQSTTQDVASAVDGGLLTLDKVETPVIGVKDAKNSRDSDSSNAFMPTRFEIPSSRILEERLEQARRLREEQRRLEMLASIHKEANFQTQQDRRREIEEKLAQLAESERWHRELLQRARLQQRIMANGGDENKLADDRGDEAGSEASTTYPTSRMVTSPLTTIATPTPKAYDATDRCAPVQRFVQVFHVKDPHQWLRENCVFIKQYFPAASCLQIQTLLAACFVNNASTTESPPDTPS